MPSTHGSTKPQPGPRKKVPVTIIIKLITPGVAFLDQMWLAGLTLIAMLVAISYMSPEPERTAAFDVASREAAAVALAAKDRVFDALCLGVVIITVALYIIFF